MRRFAITASDRYIGIFKAFLDQGWEPVKLFTAPTTGAMASNSKVVELAHARKIPIQLSRMRDEDLQDLQEQDCELLVLASYQWKVGDWRPYLRYAINFHPAPLPHYRGPYPLVQGILDKQPLWATTCHQVAPDFDTGDILAMRYFDVQPDECHESLDLKCQIESQQLAAHVARNLDTLWHAATPQAQGRYVPNWTDTDREIDFNATTDAIDLQLRAFGNFECLASIQGMRYFVRRAVCWPVLHNCAPGSLVHVDGSHHVVACRDGCVALIDWSLLPPGLRVASQTR